MSNSIGIIDAGYRGEIMAVVDNISDNDYLVEKDTRLFQLLNTDLVPFNEVSVVESLSETSRGDGGFGSTNISEQH
jgi:dUTP pyrophosphatase